MLPICGDTKRHHETKQSYLLELAERLNEGLREHPDENAIQHRAVSPREVKLVYDASKLLGSSRHSPGSPLRTQLTHAEDCRSARQRAQTGDNGTEN